MSPRRFGTAGLRGATNTEVTPELAFRVAAGFVHELSAGRRGDFAVGHFKPLNSDRYFNQCHEYIFHFTRSGLQKIDKLAIGVPYQHPSNLTRWNTKNTLRDRGNVWFIPYENKQGAYMPILHPASFPEKLPYLCIGVHGMVKDMLVYDPFMGMGTTALAAIRHGVNYIGTEIDPEYIRVAESNIKMRRLEMKRARTKQASLETVIPILE